MTKQQWQDQLPTHLQRLGLREGAEKAPQLPGVLDELRMKIPESERVGVLASPVTPETVAEVAYLLTTKRDWTRRGRCSLKVKLGIPSKPHWKP